MFKTVVALILGVCFSGVSADVAPPAGKPNDAAAHKALVEGQLAVKAKDYQKAMRLLAAACDGGDAEGCFDYGVLYYSGQGVTIDKTRAAGLFVKACDGGVLGGCYNLGVQYNSGQGVPKNQARAVGFFGKACRDSYEPKCSNLGYVFNYDRRHRARVAALSAYTCLRSDKARGDDLGCLPLGIDGVAASARPTVVPLAEACANEDATACYNLGVLFNKGELVPTNKERAAEFLRKALASDPNHEDTIRLLELVEREQSQAK